jgi:hypothetical protein
MTALLTLLHFASAWYLVGLCWLVQRVQYPLMAGVGADSFAGYEQAHVSRIGPVVAPVMLVELASGLALLATGGDVFRRPVFLLALALLVLVWLSTFLVQVPLHEVLAKGFDAQAHTSLVRTNWVRTLAWSARGLLLLWLLWSQGGLQDASGAR